MHFNADGYLSMADRTRNVQNKFSAVRRTLSFFVIFLVFWGLKLTGITMAGEAFCGIQEHTHGENCELRQLICNIEEVPSHSHTDSCLDRTLLCELPEQEAHTHGEECLGKNLICQIEEVQNHVHEESCFDVTLLCTLPEEEPHSHAADCYGPVHVCGELEREGHHHEDSCMESTLACTLSEEGHTHTDACYKEATVCGLRESEGHEHSESCETADLSCTLEETDGHSHGEDCYTAEPGCGLTEDDDHTHTEECMVSSLTCMVEEEPAHHHGDDCYTVSYSCGQEESEGHRHNESCMGPVLNCTVPEQEPHVHGEECYEMAPGCGIPENDGHTHTEECMAEGLICTRKVTEGHTHNDGCYLKVQTCEEQVIEGHIHTGACYAEEVGYICGKQETDVTHFHDASCYRLESEEMICGLEETEGHSHTDECYEMLEECPIPEHVHEENCYSDHSADLEDSDVWEATLADLVRSPVTAENIVMVARSQIGTTESTVNFQVDENGVRRGITRYGQWYGNPYADWSAMFASFCLHYAGVEGIPLNAGADAMRMDWEDLELYVPAEHHTPERGQLLFLDKDDNGEADAIAVIAGKKENVLFTVEGDLREQVIQIGSVKLEDLETEEAPEEEELSEEDASSDDETVVLEVIVEGAASSEEIVAPVETVTSEETDLPADAPVGEPVETELESVKAVSAVDTVMETLYTLDDPAIMGYGIVPETSGLMLLPEVDEGAVYAAMRTVWLDGTNGGIMSMGGSPNTSYRAEEGTMFTLPTQWQSPEKYSYVLKGWYDVVNNKYYKPGDQVKVTGNMVFYADWIAATYDIGQFNNFVADTVSTNDFVTINMFDYGPLFNVYSSKATVSFSNNSHTETWELLTRGNNPYNGSATLNYIFRDWDRGNEDISYPNGHNDRNNPTEEGSVFPGLYTGTIADLLFNPNTTVVGKQYLGTADHLFQFCNDPTDPHYGYYYYNSEWNAASYNQSAQRFYVYDYLECTRTSLEGDYVGKYADFLPLNSPYANNNGHRLNTYSYAGAKGEYNGVTHYLYDCRYNDSGSSAANVGTNFWFGMTTSINFYLPNKPGSTVSGGYGNQDIYGNDMHFQFSGDDDVWVLIDGKMVLDLGGIHGMESGDINFATGIVTVNGVRNDTLTNTLRSLSAGDHTLTLYYLERGSSMSNCAIYFNLAPRFGFSIQKEDVLTRNVLNGAQFAVFTDKACTTPAQLWTSKASHDRGDTSTNVFTVIDGAATMWGMGAGNTYYIKETAPPADENYAGLTPDGIIELTFDKSGTASYNVEIVDNGSGISPGFTVHGFRIDTETQEAYIVATNAPKWVDEVTSIHVKKQWNDQVNHNAQVITVYLTVTDQSGTVRRLQEAQLGDDNNWRFTWENLPKFWEDGSPIHYGVEEAYISGYYSRVEEVENYSTTTTAWNTVNSFENGKTYILRTGSGYLSTQNTASDTGFTWVDQNTAMNSPQALWTAQIRNGQVRFVNGAGQYLTFYYNGGSSGYPTDFFASTSGESDASKQYFRYTATNNGLRIYYDGADGRDYYLVSSMTDSKKFNYSTTSSQALLFTPMTKTVVTDTEEITSGVAYLVENSPLDQETYLQVHKVWDYGHLEDTNIHEQAQVTVMLLANGRETGRTVTLSLKNNWKDIFRGLPYEDENGEPIVYTVREQWSNTDWVPRYENVITINGSPPNYYATVTNQYRWGMGGPELPSTGTRARYNMVLCGAAIMLTSLVCGILLRRKRERRTK